MKKSLFALATVTVLLAGCGKEAIQPNPVKTPDPAETPTEKEVGNTKEWMSCFITADNKKFEGKICKGSGDECGRKSVCTIPWGKLEKPDELFFDGLTREQFRDLWNTEEGMEKLLAKGVYVTEEE